MAGRTDFRAVCMTRPPLPVVGLSLGEERHLVLLLDGEEESMSSVDETDIHPLSGVSSETVLKEYCPPTIFYRGEVDGGGGGQRWGMVGLMAKSFEFRVMKL
ncbi:hypothetical protein L1987_60734 [Smallanthus sonchifolius]|uniref:Uncharacterized protein n=1 Tax=Smallanthus sonchifolius TaxID=185202 RepID=A0ACB9D8S3_9ASTR|nr:hypothetical protein L1987_60734 [Smallanthus sonchifolius]